MWWLDPVGIKEIIFRVKQNLESYMSFVRSQRTLQWMWVILASPFNILHACLVSDDWHVCRSQFCWKKESWWWGAGAQTHTCRTSLTLHINYCKSLFLNHFSVITGKSLLSTVKSVIVGYLWLCPNWQTCRKQCQDSHFYVCGNYICTYCIV
jgi:hypothetical protein